MGLRTDSWPDFYYTDPGQVVNGGLPYEHWGRVAIPDGGPEPNNRAGNEYCAGANATERYEGAWGWSDEPCATKAAHICRIKGGWGGEGRR